MNSDYIYDMTCITQFKASFDISGVIFIIAEVQ